MTTVETMRDLAKSVTDGRPRSYVEAAKVLAEFVLEKFPVPDTEGLIDLGACQLPPQV